MASRMFRAGLVHLILLTLACGKVETHVAHDLPTTLTPPVTRKPTSAAVQAKTKIDQILNADPDKLSTGLLVLPDQSWAVAILIQSTGAAAAVFKKIHDQTGHYSQVPTDTGAIGLWVNEPFTTYPPILDKNNQALDITPTLPECLSTAQLLGHDQPKAQVNAVNTGAEAALFKTPCYVEAIFPDDSSFVAFLTWTNPYSLTGSIFSVDFKRSNGVISTVRIRALRAEKN